MESSALTIPLSVLWTKPFKLNYFVRRRMVTECGHSSQTAESCCIGDFHVARLSTGMNHESTMLTTLHHLKFVM